MRYIGSAMYCRQASVLIYSTLQNYLKSFVRSPMHLDGQKAQLGTKHGVHCRLTMGLMIGTICLYSNFGVTSVDKHCDYTGK